MIEGRLIAVVGASGVGKDSVMAGLSQTLPDFRPVRRTITRAPDPDGEAHEAVTPETFAALAAQGAFCLRWEAHGLRYGIPADVLDTVRAGETRLANLSRRVLVEAARIFPRLTVLNVTASPETLARRLAARGREHPEDIVRRIARAGDPLPGGLEVIEIGNDGPLDESVRAAIAALQPLRV